MKILKNSLIALLLTITSLHVYAQNEEESKLSISGSVDTYYRANINSSNNLEDEYEDISETITPTFAPGSSFANSPGFSLGMANLIASYEGDKAGVVADLVFGPRGQDAIFGSGNPLIYPGTGENGILPLINQLYVYWNVSDAVTFTMGNFNTFLGYEVISPTGNFNYSTSYMFSYGPFSHTGIKMDVSFGEGFSVMGAVMNPTDATDINPSGDYVGGLQFGYSNDNGGAWLNVLYDDADAYQIDLTTGWDVSDELYLGLNTTSNKDAFMGGALYAQYAVSDDLKLGVRGEYFKLDENADGDLSEAVGTIADESILNVTLSANYTVGNLTIIPEFRLDSFSEDDVVVTDVRDAASVDDIEKDNKLSSFVIAAVFSF